MSDDHGAHTLNPTAVDRVRGLTAPTWVRSVAFRRCVAVLLMVGAGALTVIDNRIPTSPTALVAAHDLKPGEVLTASDVRLVPVPAELMPDDSPDIEAVTGRHVTGPVHSGEIIARHRLLDPRLPAEMTGDDQARLVPVRPADESSTAFMRPGDTVDLLTENGDVLARAAIVALTPQVDSSGRPGPVLVALPANAAHRVASAGLREQITFVLH
ncbi:SAF domain-containing protein [Gordonia sp. PDNC005]|uniref:SAF domain-containing protein n=1 Tax=unclassified Gordonia (in: high G+C Gram-positive bacteria) TaxID=2657482 RepID=UPI0019653300|nr:SAF domain-containing protein [Gordonia sp. PDNC005]QRY63151.1 SAF domain-containing protein [Gordonia sp. PDNC005]